MYGYVTCLTNILDHFKVHNIVVSYSCIVHNVESNLDNNNNNNKNNNIFLKSDIQKSSMDCLVPTYV